MGGALIYRMSCVGKEWRTFAKVFKVVAKVLLERGGKTLDRESVRNMVAIGVEVTSATPGTIITTSKFADLAKLCEPFVNITGYFF